MTSFRIVVYYFKKQLHCEPEKSYHFIFDYNSCVSWSIFKNNFRIIGNRNQYCSLQFFIYLTA